jgi:protein-S-isoprenylcysteine O-methyltransferase Ste14
MTPNQIIRALWLAFVLIWVLFAVTAKRTARRPPFWSGAGGRFLVIALIFAVLQFRVMRGMLHAWQIEVTSNPDLQEAGIAIALCGYAFALWARFYLGRNWGMPMSLREDHRLVTGGPYAFVRHPIYSGFLIAMLGSALAGGFIWLIMAAVLGVYFVISALTEEKLMLAQFPGEYPAYKRRTKMLIPFVL